MSSFLKTYPKKLLQHPHFLVEIHTSSKQWFGHQSALLKFNSSPLKNGAWKTTFLLFRGKLLNSGGGIHKVRLVATRMEAQGIPLSSPWTDKFWIHPSWALEKKHGTWEYGPPGFRKLQTSKASFSGSIRSSSGVKLSQSKVNLVENPIFGIGFFLNDGQRVQSEPGENLTNLYALRWWSIFPFRQNPMVDDQ